jgi:hypothetical protein
MPTGWDERDVSLRRLTGLAAAVLGLSAGCVMVTAAMTLADTGGSPYANAAGCSATYGPDSWCINSGDI